MSVAFFDLDNTLLAGDSDHLWGEFLAEIGAVPSEEHRRENDRFLRDYQAGTLDHAEFLRFQLHPLTCHDEATLLEWRETYVRERIVPIVLPKARALLAEHRAHGRTLVIVTSTNSFITAPIAALLEVDTLLATVPERSRGRFTGRVSGVPCYAKGKVARVGEWLERTGEDLAGSWFYTDSHTDLPLLEAVTHPVAVDPDERLRARAVQCDWAILSLR